MKVLLVVFREQNPFGTIWSFEPLGYFLLFEHGQIEPGHFWSLNSQGMLSFMITTRSLNNQDMTRTVKTLFLKQWRHYFSGKYLRDRYCIDIIWCLCEGQNSWFCKASLRICYVSLFECNGPWMLKTVINGDVWNRRLQNQTEKYHIPCF